MKRIAKTIAIPAPVYLLGVAYPGAKAEVAATESKMKVAAEESSLEMSEQSMEDLQRAWKYAATEEQAQ